MSYDVKQLGFADKLRIAASFKATHGAQGCYQMCYLVKLLYRLNV